MSNLEDANLQRKARQRRHNVLFMILILTTITILSYSGFMPGRGIPTSSQNAFCVFLDGTDEHYFLSTRMLVYQLLHAPSTRAPYGVDFVVLVSESVEQSRRDRLVEDGAIIVEADTLSTLPEFAWITPGRSRWANVIDKMHVFKLVKYDRVLLLDSDTIVNKPLHGIFTSPEAALMYNKGDPTQVMNDEAPQPSSYLMAANSGPFSPIHDYPSARGDKINAGFVLLKPSMDLYDYLLSIGRIQGRFNPSSPEQNWWIYAFRNNGNLPWIQVDSDWTTNCPNYGDYQHGIYSFHEKWWILDKEKELIELMRRSRFRMEGYWLGEELLKRRKLSNPSAGWR